MVKAWYMDNDFSDQRLEHHRNPPEYLSLDNLYKKTGVEYFNINVNTSKTDGVLDKIKKDRGYTYEDEIVCSKECLPNYEEKIKSFFEEHLHTDEEIRLVLDGSGYFDVRDGTDQWIRIAVSAGDMIVIPSGIYHRFTLDTNNYIRAKRFFIGDPVWLPYNRPADNLPCREEYLHKLEKGFVGNFIEMAEGIIIFALWYIALAYNYCKENFCNDNRKNNDKKVEPTKEEKPDSQPELAPNKELDFIIQPLSNDNKEDSPKPEDSPTVQDVMSDVQDFAAAIEDHLDNKEEEE